jgi:hypothetical protein
VQQKQAPIRFIGNRKNGEAERNQRFGARSFPLSLRFLHNVANGH